MSESSRVGAVVLAAGASSRMGETKQLLRLRDGKTLLARTLERVRASRVDEIVLVLGHEAERVRAGVDAEDVKVVLNERYREGMSASLALGIGVLGDDVVAAFIVLGDQPFVQAATLDLLIDRYVETRAKIVVPVFEGARGNPALLDRSIFREVMALTGDVGARAIFGKHADEILKVPVADRGVLVDLDNREDWERYGSGC
jgi:molybdenum cofactor cytidylyltransferase